MVVHSKHLYTIIDGKGDKSILVEGYNKNYKEDYRDVHYWCENEYGEIIDTTPIDDRYRSKKSRYYIKWENQEESIKEYSSPTWECIMKFNHLPNVDMARKQLLNNITKNKDYYNERCCMINAMALKNKYPNYKVCIGSFGYKISPGVIDIVWGR